MPVPNELKIFDHIKLHLKKKCKMNGKDILILYLVPSAPMDSRLDMGYTYETKDISEYNKRGKCPKTL